MRSGVLRQRVRRRPFLVAELALVALLAAGPTLYAGLVVTGPTGAWTAANATLTVAGLLAVVLVVHGVRDLLALATVASDAGSPLRVVAGAAWRLAEVGLAVGVVVGGLFAGALANDLAAAGGGEGGDAMGMVVGITVLGVAAGIGGLVAMIVARGVATRAETGGSAAAGDSEEATAADAATERGPQDVGGSTTVGAPDADGEDGDGTGAGAGDR